MGRLRYSGRNKKQEEEIRAFLEGAEQPDIDKRRKRQTLELLKLERRRLHVRVRKPYGKRVLEQAAYLSPTAWILQGIFILALGWLFHVEEKESLLSGLLFCAPVIGIVGFTEILRSFRQEMWELEQACRYNLRQLMGIRLLLFGIGDSVIAGLVMIMGFQTGISASELLLFFLIPQMLSDCVYLYLMTRFRRRFQGTALIGAAAMMLFFWLSILEILTENPWFIKRVSEPFALLVTVLTSIGLLAWCCRRFLKGIEAECCGA